MVEAKTEIPPLDVINNRRQCLHMHSLMYYVLDDPFWSDARFDEVALELVALHKKHPELVDVGYMPEVFADWTGDTGFHLPRKPEHIARARRWRESLRDWHNRPQTPPEAPVGPVAVKVAEEAPEDLGMLF